MSRLINVPSPGAAAANPTGVATYRTEIVDIRVEPAADGAVLCLRIGGATAELALDQAGAAHLAALLRPEGGHARASEQ